MLLKQLVWRHTVSLGLARRLSAEAGSKQNSSQLYALRKQTGYAFTKCREALEKHDGNLEKAIKWLNEQAQAEGWARADKLKNRQTQQGTLVLYNERLLNRIAILELNCETDFVAKNDKFLEMSSQIAISVVKNSDATKPKNILEKEELAQIKYHADESKTIGDQIALSIGIIGENMSLKRAIVFNRQKNEHLSWYMHGKNTMPLNNCHFGKYGSIVNISLSKPSEAYTPFELGRQLAQHIVGMKPLVVGEKSTSLEPKSDKTNEEAENEDETRLLYQEFLMKPNSKVYEFLDEHDIVVNDFVRLECGETVN